MVILSLSFTLYIIDYMDILLSVTFVSAVDIHFYYMELIDLCFTDNNKLVVTLFIWLVLLSQLIAEMEIYMKRGHMPSWLRNLALTILMSKKREPG